MSRSSNQSVTITVPGAVWLDALDPLASDMQGDLGLPEPTTRKKGYGRQYVYERVPWDVALELADYLIDRASMLLRQEPESQERAVHYAAIKAGDRMRAVVAADKARYPQG
jgi:hypothetical protein